MKYTDADARIIEELRQLRKSLDKIAAAIVAIRPPERKLFETLDEMYKAWREMR